jgi:hypothetical protein
MDKVTDERLLSLIDFYSKNCIGGDEMVAILLELKQGQRKG